MPEAGRFPSLLRQLQHYLDVRKVVGDFRTYVQDQLDRLEGGAKDDLQRKHASLLAFDYEAAARLKAWASFDQIIQVLQLDGDFRWYH